MDGCRPAALDGNAALVLVGTDEIDIPIPGSHEVQYTRGIDFHAR